MVCGRLQCGIRGVMCYGTWEVMKVMWDVAMWYTAATVLLWPLGSIEGVN